MVPDEDSVDDHNGLEPTPAQWQLFEMSVATAQANLDPGSTVVHNVTVEGILSHRPRQVDVMVSGSVGGQDFSIAIECKRYAKPLGIGAVDEFAGQLLDLGVDRGVLIALSGLTQPAQDRAAGSQAPKIAVGDLLDNENHVEADIPLLFAGFGDCPNTNCFTGALLWTWWTSGAKHLRAGSCDTCGTWAVECPTCGEIDALEGEPCYSCETRIEQVLDRKGTEVEAIDVDIGGHTTTYENTNEAPPSDP